MKTIHWAPLPHCPAGQLQKANPTDAGADIKIAKDVWIRSYSALPFEWEDVGLKDELDLPELFSPENYGVFYSQDSYYPDMKVRTKFVVDFDIPDRMQVIADLNKLTQVSITERNTHEFLVGANAEIKELQEISGVNRVQQVSVLQRKKYKPILVPTGIKVQPEELGWNMLALRSSMTKYAVGMAHSIGVIDYTFDGQLMAPLYPIHGQTVFAKGERVCQLININQEEVKFNQVNVEDLEVNNRGGFGSTGGTGLKIA